MKLFLAIFLVSTAAFATSMDRFVATVSPVDANIKSVSLSQSGMIFIQKTNGSYKQIHLVEANKNEFSFLANRLNGVELTTEKHLVVCMMILPVFARQTLYVRFNGLAEMQEILSFESCAVTSYTRPTNEEEYFQARLLKSQLITLAHQYAQD
jgi:hypothetical protein